MVAVANLDLRGDRESGTRATSSSLVRTVISLRAVDLDHTRVLAADRHLVAVLVDAAHELGALGDLPARRQTMTACFERHRVRRVEHVARQHLDLERTVLAADDLDVTVDLADQRLALGDARLEQLLDAGQTLGDVRTTGRDTAGVERPHGELRARLADRLRGDDADRLADLDQASGGQVAPVAHAADALAGLAGHDAAHLDPAELGRARDDASRRLVVDLLARALDDLVADDDVLARRCGPGSGRSRDP